VEEGTVGNASLEAVLRENPPYGILGGMEETSASFEARYAPPSYPTYLDCFEPLDAWAQAARHDRLIDRIAIQLRRQAHPIKKVLH
jgi:hypothetical protein